MINDGQSGLKLIVAGNRVLNHHAVRGGVDDRLDHGHLVPPTVLRHVLVDLGSVTPFHMSPDAFNTVAVGPAGVVVEGTAVAEDILLIDSCPNMPVIVKAGAVKEKSHAAPRIVVGH